MLSIFNKLSLLAIRCDAARYGKTAVGATVDGRPVEATPRTILGPQYALVPVELSSPGESKRVRVEFADE